MGLKEIEDMDFIYTTMSLNDVYEVSYKHALEMIKKNGGKVTGDEVSIAVQAPEQVKFEKSFEGLFPVKKVTLYKEFTDTLSFSFEGTGIVLRGEANKNNSALPDEVIRGAIYIDGKKTDDLSMSTDSRVRKLEIFWNYQLTKGHHEVKVVLNNAKKGYFLKAIDYLVY